MLCLLGDEKEIKRKVAEGNRGETRRGLMSSG